MMFTNLDEALAFAVEREDEAARFYAELSARTGRESLKTLLDELEAEERGHRALLEGLRAARPAVLTAGGPVPDLGLTDGLEDAPAGPDDSVQDLLVHAARREAQAAALYERLAGATSEPDIRTLFEFLRQQEKRHKLRLELEYEAHILVED
jgi:rubrerythrin